MISLKKKLLEIKDPTSDNYTAELKNIIFDKIYGKKEEMYYAILKKESNDLKLRFSAFYCLFTKYRRFEQKYQLFNLVETYIHLFSEDKYIYLVDIVYSQYYKFKALDINDIKCYIKSLEYAQKVISNYNVISKNIGCFNNYADIVISMASVDGIIRKKDVKKALEYVDRAIFIQEKEKKLPPYANYYCSKASLYLIQKKYTEAEQMVLLAIAYERTDLIDSTTRLTYYHNVELEIKTKKNIRLVDYKIEKFYKEFSKIQKKMNDEQIKYIEILGFFATIIALFIGSISMTITYSDFSTAAALILVLAGGLCFSYIILLMIFSEKMEKKRIFISMVTALLLIGLGVIIG